MARIMRGVDDLGYRRLDHARRHGVHPHRVAADLTCRRFRHPPHRALRRRVRRRRVARRTRDRRCRRRQPPISSGEVTSRCAYSPPHRCRDAFEDAGMVCRRTRHVPGAARRQLDPAVCHGHHGRLVSPPFATNMGSSGPLLDYRFVKMLVSDCGPPEASLPKGHLNPCNPADRPGPSVEKPEGWSPGHSAQR